MNTIAERATKGGGGTLAHALEWRNYGGAGYCMRLSGIGKFQDKEHKCSFDLDGKQVISRIEEISTYLGHGF